MVDPFQSTKTYVQQIKYRIYTVEYIKKNGPCLTLKSESSH